MNAVALRDRLRRLLPGVFAFYKRRIRHHVIRDDPHYAIARWVNEGLRLREALMMADVCLDGDGPWFTDGRGLQWSFDPAIWGSTVGAATGSLHESAEIDAVCKRLGPSSVVIDIGANVGAFALPVARATRARVIAVEPVSSTFGLLNANVRRNGCAESVSTVKCALSDAGGEVVITTGAQSANHVLLELTVARADEERVPVVTLDVLVESEPRIDLIKVDVEGLELKVMRGAMETLTRHNPAVLMEIESRWTTRYAYEPSDIFAFMRGAGYHYEPLTTAGPVKATTVVADLGRANNFLFTHSGVDQL